MSTPGLHSRISDGSSALLPPLLPLSFFLSSEERLERDYFMSAEEARSFGIIDEVIQQRPQATPL